MSRYYLLHALEAMAKEQKESKKMADDTQYTEYNVRLIKERDTKNKTRYMEGAAPGATAIIETVYLRKEIAGNAQFIEVTVRVPK